MNKKLILLPILGLTLSASIAIGVTAHSVYATSPSRRTFTVDFFNNYLREEFTLSNGFTGKGNNLLYKSVEVMEYDHLEKPENPVRKNYEFAGWYKEEACGTEWNFANDTIHEDLRLFAKWTFAQEEEELEPPYTPPSDILPSGSQNSVEIYSVMNFKINDGVVKLPTAAISRLESFATSHDGNVLPLIEYKVSPAISNRGAHYENKTITAFGQTIQVKDDSLNLVLDNSTYETKAKKYEAKIDEENENYHVMLAGSSSIEFWESSKEDLAPVVSYNHGIGGTTIEEWTDKLNQRLVYPYKPKMVVYYVGINNVINSKQDANTIWNNLQKFFNDTHEAMPDTKVQYIMMNLIPGYSTYWNIINTVNDQVVEYQKSNTWLTLINPGTALLKENGEPNASDFRTDGLHLSYYGYVVWGGIIKESILKGLENN